METYTITEEMLTEYTHVPNTNEDILDRIEAESHEEAYRLFVQRHPQKAGVVVNVFDGRVGVEYGGRSA
jgi:hypothetical protein